MRSLRPILVVVYDFPPCGGAGTQRWAKFAKHLPELGYEPIIVTASAEGADADLDSSLLEPALANLSVTRVPRSARPRAPLAERLQRSAGFRVDREDWARAALPAAIEAAMRHRVRAVVTTVSPYALWSVGHAVRQALDVPWILDLRDPWALDGWRRFPSVLHARHDLACMRHALRSADAVIANTTQAGTLLARHDARNLQVIENGFDADDFPNSVPDPVRDGRFHLTHVGTLHRPTAPPRRWRDPLRFAWRSIDPTGRSGRFLLEAMARLGRRSPRLLERLQVDLVGRLHGDHGPLARSLGVEGRLTLHGVRSHRESLEILVRGHAVFVPLHRVLDRDPAAIVPAKLYEALASERFVLGCMPEGDAASLIRRTGAGVVCAPDDVAAITDALERMLLAWQEGRCLQGTRRSELKSLARRSLTRRLAAVLDEAIGECRGSSEPLSSAFRVAEAA